MFTFDQQAMNVVKAATELLRGTRKAVIYCSIIMIALLVVSPEASAQRSRRQGKSPSKKTPAQVIPQVTEEERKQLAEAASQSREKLIQTSKTYRESLEKLAELQQRDEKRAADMVESRKKLLELGIIAKREIAESEQALTTVQGRIAGTKKKIEDVDLLITEVEAAEQLAQMPQQPAGVMRSTATLIRYVGATHWALSDFGKVDAFFRLKFGHPLPVSAFGQTETHNHLGFDHREAVDVAVHPDSAEGQALINYLQQQGISFIAIRAAIPGSATGAHIHIGPGSRRIAPQ